MENRTARSLVGIVKCGQPVQPEDYANFSYIRPPEYQASNPAALQNSHNMIPDNKVGNSEPAYRFPDRVEIKHEIIRLLQSHGGSIKISSDHNSVYLMLAERLGVSTAAQLRVLRSGGTAWEAAVGYAKKELVLEGVIHEPSSSGHGYWFLKPGHDTPIPPPPTPYELLMDLLKQNGV